MITDEELAELSDDPELAFVEFERIMRAWLEAVEKTSPHGFDVKRRAEYMSKVLAAAQEYDITNIKKWNMSPSNTDEFLDIFANFISDIDHSTTILRIRHAPRSRKHSAGLDGNTKTKIHHFISQIKSVIEMAHLPDDRRDALYDKLNDFALEVDKARTSLQAGTAVWLALCDAIGQGFERLEPARGMIDSIARLLGRAKDSEGALRPALPRPVMQRQIEAPRDPLTRPPSLPTPELDDDIPF
jgi:hypothetical protein